MRQLEALVRLSEALARLRCTEKITPAYVREVRSYIHPHRSSPSFQYDDLAIIPAVDADELARSACIIPSQLSQLRSLSMQCAKREHCWAAVLLRTLPRQRLIVTVPNQEAGAEAL